LTNQNFARLRAIAFSLLRCGGKRLLRAGGHELQTLIRIILSAAQRVALREFLLLTQFAALKNNEFCTPRLGPPALAFKIALL
jgi:hypothetical protein